MAKKMKKIWKCRYCDGFNSKKDFYCVSCGARWLEEANKDKDICLEEMQPYIEEAAEEVVEEVLDAEKECEQGKYFSSYKEPLISFDNEEIIEYARKFVLVGILLFFSISFIFVTWKLIATSVEELHKTYIYIEDQYEIESSSLEYNAGTWDGTSK